MPRDKQGMRCAIAICTNYNSRRNDLSFFRFPKDPLIRKEWILKSKRADKFNVDVARVCSDHFEKRDFARELTGNFSKRRLVSPTIPSLYLDSPPTKNGVGRQRRKILAMENCSEMLSLKLPQSLELLKEVSYINIVSITIKQL